MKNCNKQNNDTRCLAVCKGKSVWAKQKRASRKTYTLAERTRFELVEP